MPLSSTKCLQLCGKRESSTLIRLWYQAGFIVRKHSCHHTKTPDQILSDYVENIRNSRCSVWYKKIVTFISHLLKNMEICTQGSDLLKSYATSVNYFSKGKSYPWQGQNKAKIKINTKVLYVITNSH